MLTIVPSPFPSWATAFERYRHFRATHDLRDRTRRKEMQRLEEFRRAFPSTGTPHEVTEEMLLQFFLGLKDRGLAPQSRKDYSTALRQFLRYLGEPAERWIPRIPDTGPKDEGRYLEAWERQALWAACPTPAHEVILAMGLGQGARRSDTVWCRLEDFSPSVNDPKTLTFHGKGEKFATVTVPVHPKLRETLLNRYLPWRTAQLAHVATFYGWSPADPGTLLFVVSKHRKGARPMGMTTIDSRLAEIYRASGVEPGGWPSHNLRRTWAENRLEAATKEFDFASQGTNPAMALEMALRVVQREGRWKQVETLRRYLVRRALSSLDSVAQTAV